MPLPFPYDWKNPDPVPVFRWRMARLQWLRVNPQELPYLKAYYREHPGQFITDWGMTFDPRNVRRKLPAALPFILFPKQDDLVTWLMERWRNGEDGVLEKSRDMGATWVAMSLACTLCLFNPQMSIGCGSRKEQLVDVLGLPDSLLEKARIFLTNLPPEFRGGWDRKKHSAHLRITFPETGSIISGEAGDNIGRGGRQSLYLVDEAAHLERPELADASLSANTDVRIDMSSVNGNANPFATKARGGVVKVFTMHWRDDPRKDDAWYAAQCAKLDPVIVAQEIDINYSASVAGIVIPQEWVQAAIGAHTRLGVTPTGERRGALDVADEGRDKNAFAATHGILLTHISEWSGVGSDIFGTTERAISLCRDLKLPGFQYDADGLGAGVRGDARTINARDQHLRPVEAHPFRGSAAVVDPERPITTAASIESADKSERLNQDFYANYKAQSWWMLRLRFQLTWRALQGQPIADYDMLISLDPDLPLLSKLCIELSQPTYLLNGTGKILIDKAPEGARSPNLADAVMIAYAPREFVRPPIKINPDLLK